MILALDLATRFGWAVGAPCSRPLSGAVHLDGTRPGQRFLQLARRVQTLIDEHAVTEVVIEDAFIGARLSAAGTLYGYRAVAMVAAENRGLPVTPVPPSRWRKGFLGAGGGKRGALKAATIQQCRAHGWAPRTEDEADALGLWSYWCSVRDPQHLFWREPA